MIISSSAVSAPAGARAIIAAGKAGQVYSTGFALPSAIKSYLEDGSQKCFALWNPYELGYLATYATHLKLAGKLDLTPGTTFEAGKAGHLHGRRRRRDRLRQADDVHQGNRRRRRLLTFVKRIRPVLAGPYKRNSVGFPHSDPGRANSRLAPGRHPSHRSKNKT